MNWSINGKTVKSLIKDGKEIVKVERVEDGKVLYEKQNGLDFEVLASDLTKYDGGSERFVVTVREYGEPASGKSVTIAINGVTYNRTTGNDGTCSIGINPTPGVYPVSVTCEDVTISRTITVLSRFVDNSDVTKYELGAEVYTCTVLDTSGSPVGSGETVTVNIAGGFTDYSTDSNGMITVPLNQSPDNYMLTVSYDGCSTANAITILPRLIGSDLTKYCRCSQQYTVEVLDATGQHVSDGTSIAFTLDGRNYTRTTTNGYATLKINLMPDTYSIAVNYGSVTTLTNTITVIPRLTASDLTMQYGDGSQFVAQVCDCNGGAVAGETVEFNINGNIVTKTTGSDGKAKLSISLQAGTYTITSKLSSTTESVQNTITVNPVHTYSITCASDKQAMLTTESATISGVYKMDGTGVSGETITIYDGSTSLGTCTTGTGGAYSKNISGLTAGTHSIKASHTNVESTAVSISVTEPVHSYVLALSCSTPIIQSGSGASVVATLTDNNVAVSGETLTYEIKHGSTTITTGSDTTDADGQITISYTGTGAGIVNVSASAFSISDSIVLYDGSSNFVQATVTGNSITLGKAAPERWLISTGEVVIDWGDGTNTTVNNPTTSLTHNYTDGQSTHTIIFGGEVTSLGGYCFRVCTGLTSIVIPDSVTSLGDYCFWYCTGLTSVTIPSSITSIGNDCFENCSALVDYELYWTGTAIIQYDADKMPVNSGTRFTVPYGETDNYIAKGYPSDRLIEADRITVTTDKNIITDDETATITAKLYLDRTVASGKTITYTIRNNGETIDTGTDTTDTNGEIEIEYTGEMLGKIDITTTYNTLTQTITIYDTIALDRATTLDHTDSIYDFTVSTYLTRNTNDTRFYADRSSITTIGYYNIQRYNINDGILFSIEITSLTSQCNLRVQKRNSGTNTNVRGIVPDSTGVYLFEVTSTTTKIYRDGVLVNEYTDSASDTAQFQFRVDKESVADFRYKDLTVISGSVDTGIDTSISLSSDESTIYTDESVTFSGALVDEDNTPIEDASVKLYRGASLVATLTTDSNGEFEEEVSGLSAGTYSFKAVYDGDSTYNGSQSSTVSITVTEPVPVPDTITITGTSIIQTGTVDTITATLLDGSTPVAGETLSYQIKHGSTVIDSGSDTTDANGQITISYTGTGVGDVDIIVSYDNLSETVTIEDLEYYNDGTSITGLIIDSNVLCVSENGMIKISKSSSGEEYVKLPVTHTSSDNFSVEYEIAKLGTTQHIAMWLYNSTSATGCWCPYTISLGKFEGKCTNTSINYSTSIAVGDKVKIEQLNGVISIYHNGHKFFNKTQSFSGNYYTGLYTNNGRVQYIKNIKVKKI